MDWQAAKEHCKEKNWEWSLNLINKAEKEMSDLQKKYKALQDSSSRKNQTIGK